MTDDSAGGSEDGPPDENRAGGPGERLVEEIAKHDEDLAADVRRIIERGAQLHEELREATEELEERDARVEELEATLKEHSGDGAFEWADQHEDDDEAAEQAADADEGSADEPGGDGDETSEDDAGGEPADPERVEELEAELAERDRRIEELEAKLAQREDRIQELSETLDEREDEIEDLTERLKRKQADFQNYKKRAERKREDIKERATEDLVERLLDVRDNLRRAIENDHENVASLLDGVEMTLREFDRVLEDENVAEIAPEPGSEIDPSRHEVMMRVDSDQPEDTVADMYAPGYEMAGKVIRPAKVTVSTGPAEDDGEATEPADTDEVESDAATATANDE